MILCPALSGVLSWASFPPLNGWYFAWVALAPLLFYVARCARTRQAFFGGACAGFLQFFGLLYWIPSVLCRYGGLPSWLAWPLYLLLAAALAVFPGVACALTHHCMKVNRSWMLLFAPAWVAVEYARSAIPFGGFPWLLTGYSQTDCLRLMQSADIWGVYGVSFLAAWVNAALVRGLLREGRRMSRFWPTAAGALLLTACLVYGSAALNRWGRVQPDRRAALLQANLSMDGPESELRAKYSKGYVKMAEPLAGKGVDLLILPESPSPLFFQYDADYRETMRSLARRFPLGMVFNNIYFQEAAGESRYFNSAFFLDGNGRESGRYDKIHLVPFGEYVPWQKLFFFSRTISMDVGSFQPGENVACIPADGHRVNALICFEAVFPDLSRRFLLAGSQLIINLTNDGWYGDTAAPYQHLAMARWRAVESRRYLLRAANSGISAFIAPTGRIEAKTGLFREETAVSGFSFLDGQTFYVRHGSSLPVICAIISFLSGLCCLARGARRRW